MKILLLLGSPHENGVGASALLEVRKILEERGLECDYRRLGEFLPNSCTACRACRDGGGCIVGDIGSLSESFRESAGIIVAAPVYYGSPNGGIISLMDRLFQSSKFDKRGKVGAAIVTARRGGCTASFDVLNKYFTISQMPIASSSYWNILHTGEDSEGMNTARRLAENFAELVYAVNERKERSEKRPELS